MNDNLSSFHNLRIHDFLRGEILRLADAPNLLIVGGLGDQPLSASTVAAHISIVCSPAKEETILTTQKHFPTNLKS